MPTEIDYEFLQSITWYALDLDGHVGAFELGEIPTLALSIATRWADVDDLIRALPECSGYRMLARREDYWKGVQAPGVSTEAKESQRDAMWPIVEAAASELPRRGIFQFKATPSPYGQLPPTYNLSCVPLSPIDSSSLPVEAQSIVRQILAPIRFSDVELTDVRRW